MGLIQILLLWMLSILWWLSNLVLKPKHLSCEKVFKREAEMGRFSEAVYEATRKRKFNLVSRFGYMISCELLEPQNVPEVTRRKLAILCHGFSHAKYGSLIYAEIFLRLGYSVIIYDHRNHGLSGKAYTSMGYFEKYDLTKVVDWCYESFGADCRIVTHGESMGAATVILQLEIDDRVTGVIADCAYSDLKQLLRYQLAKYYHLPLFLLPIESLLAFLRAGFWYSEVSPIQVASKSDKPIMFIHGKKDGYVPTYMSKQMYACKKRNKAIYLVAGAKHAQSCLINRSGYAMRVKEFLEAYLSK